jgi:hypothetical protein
VETVEYEEVDLGDRFRHGKSHLFYAQGARAGTSLMIAILFASSWNL